MAPTSNENKKQRLNPSELPETSQKLILQHIIQKKPEKFSDFCNKHRDHLGKPAGDLRLAVQQRRNYLLRAYNDRPRLFVQILNKFRVPVSSALELRVANLSSSSSEDEEESKLLDTTVLKKRVQIRDIALESSSSDEVRSDSGFESDSSIESEPRQERPSESRPRTPTPSKTTSTTMNTNKRGAAAASNAPRIGKKSPF
jgi:hypothetical protein